MGERLDRTATLARAAHWERRVSDIDLAATAGMRDLVDISETVRTLLDERDTALTRVAELERDLEGTRELGGTTIAAAAVDIAQLATDYRRLRDRMDELKAKWSQAAADAVIAALAARVRELDEALHGIGRPDPADPDTKWRDHLDTVRTLVHVKDAALAVNAAADIDNGESWTGAIEQLDRALEEGGFNA